VLGTEVKRANNVVLGPPLIGRAWFMYKKNCISQHRLFYALPY